MLINSINLQDFNKEDNNHQNLNWIRNINPFFYVIIVLGIVFFLYQVLGGFLAFIAGGEKLDSDIKVTRMILSFSQFMFILAPTIFFARLQTPDLKNIFKIRLPALHLLILTILGILLIQPFLQGYIYFQDYCLDHLPVLQNMIKQMKDLFDMMESAEIKIITAYSNLEYAIVVFVICITPAICEELLFRGFVLSNLKRVSKATAAIILSSFLFSVYHFQPFNIIPLAMLGGFLGFIVYYSNSIFLGMLGHFLNNFFASYYLYKFGKQDFETPHLTNSEMFNTGVTAIISFLLFISVLYTFYKFRDKNPGKGDFE